ncbi:MAG: DUF1491 family protein [Devosia sp.]
MFRSDLWVGAFVRRHNDIGHICVIVRRGDPIAGQIFIEIDHLDGTVTLLTPAPAVARRDDDADRLFAIRFDHGTAADTAARIAREADFDPDLWVIALEMRGSDAGVTLVKS